MLPRLLFIIFCLFVVNPLWAATAPDIDDQTRAIAQELRCVVCQNLSVADSPSEMAQQMRGDHSRAIVSGEEPAADQRLLCVQIRRMGSARPDDPRFQPVGVGLAICRS